MNDNEMERMYLDWCNNFLTIEKFAEHYNLSIKYAAEIIIKGRIINHAKLL